MKRILIAAMAAILTACASAPQAPQTIQKPANADQAWTEANASTDARKAEREARLMAQVESAKRQREAYEAEQRRKAEGSEKARDLKSAEHQAALAATDARIKFEQAQREQEIARAQAAEAKKAAEAKAAEERAKRFDAQVAKIPVCVEPVKSGSWKTRDACWVGYAADTREVFMVRYLGVIGGRMSWAVKEGRSNIKRFIICDATCATYREVAVGCDDECALAQKIGLGALIRSHTLFDKTYEVGWNSIVGIMARDAKAGAAPTARKDGWHSCTIFETIGVAKACESFGIVYN